MSIEKSHLYQAAILDLATKAFRRILIVMVDYEEDVRNGKITENFHERKTIAKRAKCSVRTMDNFIKWIKEDPAVSHILQIKSGSQKRGERKSNTYLKMDGTFADTIILLRANNYLYKWDKCSKEVLKNLAEDDFWLCRKTLGNPRLMNNEIAVRNCQKLQSIKSYTKSSLRSGSLDSLQESKSWPSINKPKKSFGILQEMPISYSTKERLMEFYSPYALRKAVTAAEHLSGIGKDPDSWEGFLFYMARKATLENLNRKTRL